MGNFDYNKWSSNQNKTLLQIALVAGIVILSANGMDGWGLVNIHLIMHTLI